MCSNDDASKLQHEGTIIQEQEEKEAKILAKKPINNSKEKIAKMDHGPKAMDIPNSLSKPSKKILQVPQHCRRYLLTPK